MANNETIVNFNAEKIAEHVAILANADCMAMCVQLLPRSTSSVISFCLKFDSLPQLLCRCNLREQRRAHRRKQSSH